MTRRDALVPYLLVLALLLLLVGTIVDRADGATALPGTVQAENYDPGGEGIGYHDTYGWNTTAPERQSGDGDIVIGYTAAGEWMRYTVTVSTTASYTLATRVAAPAAGSRYHFEVDGVVEPTVTIPSTGSWATYQTVSQPAFTLTAGTHVVRFVEETGDFNINWWSATPATRVVPLGAGGINSGPFFTDTAYRNLFLTYFSSMTPGNAMKWVFTEPQQNHFDFADADSLVDYARANGKYVRGHTLVWFSQLPSWVTSGSWTKATLLAVMRNHITVEMQHFAGRAGEWDVVNEPLDGTGNWRSNVFLTYIGPTYVEEALRAARAADPAAKLCINDYGIDWQNAKSDALYNIVADFKARGVPIDCVGFEAHWVVGNTTPQGPVQANLQRFADLGVDVEITEADVAGSTSTYQQQATVYHALAGACYAVTRCTRFTTWGVTDKYSWLGAAKAPLLFDINYQPKPAYTTVATDLHLG